MKYKVIVRHEAENDLKEAFSWYEDKRTGLGYDFLLQVDAGINFINRNPEIHPIEYKGTRKHVIKRFPYKIIYLVNNRSCPDTRKKKPRINKETDKCHLTNHFTGSAANCATAP